MKLRTTCPRCNSAVPFVRTQWGLGKPFTCVGCGAKLVIERNYWLPLAAICAFWFGKIELKSVTEQVWLVLGLLVALAMAQVQLMKPQLIEPDRP